MFSVGDIIFKIINALGLVNGWLIILWTSLSHEIGLIRSRAKMQRFLPAPSSKQCPSSISSPWSEDYITEDWVPSLSLEHHLLVSKLETMKAHDLASETWILLLLLKGYIINLPTHWNSSLTLTTLSWLSKDKFPCSTSLWTCPSFSRWRVRYTRSPDRNF